MKHLLSSAIVVTFSLLTSAAFAESPPCSTGDSLPFEPLYAMNGVPRDARLSFEWDQCRGSVSAELEDGDGKPVPSSTSTSGRVRTVTPAAPLAANSLHRVVIREGGELTGKIPFTTGADLLDRTELEAPVIESVTSEKNDQGAYERVVFTLSVTQKRASRLGFFVVETADERRETMATGEERVELHAWDLPHPGETKCFTVAYEDPSGARSESAPSCVTQPDDGGCNASPHKKGSAAGLAGFLAIALASARRRRSARVR